jgi:hypothetical protein
LAGLAESPVVLLVGAHPVGKSMLIQSAAVPKDPRYFTLEDAGCLAVIKADPVGFPSTYNEPLARDEIQGAPEVAENGLFIRKNCLS